ncbi:AraC family transcriptional regulator [Paenibacillus shunpengii]|uniref:AraC family transcriptional regulator n=1 Tax=Paenibacillus shunpengii TaxID=2054424 RepID=A0ABW5SN84_9BACL
MDGYTFNIEKPLIMQMTGKFASPAPDWVHMSRILMDYELFVQTKGRLFIADDRGEHVLEEGDFLLMPPRTKQFGYKESDCSFYWLHFTSEEPSCTIPIRDYQPVQHHIFIPHKGRLRGMDKIVIMMKQLQDSMRSYQDPTLGNYMATTILCELYHQSYAEDNISGKKLKQLQLYNDIVDYINWNRFEALKVSAIADYFGYNSKYLSHLFASVAGVTLKQYIIQQKMEAAAFLLSDTNQTVQEIAMQLGYHDSQHFMKSFKQITHLTPTDFRNAAANRLLYYK